MKKVLPGPYTFILNASKNIPKHFQSKRKTIGIRVVDHPIPTEIVRMLGNPIMTTSLKSDDTYLEYMNDAEEIYAKFGKLVDIVIDGGPCGLTPSTLVDCSTDEIIVLREGLGDVNALFT
jgi:tRNA threonylcarbamoyl adenosine modification protein (Sua5/YciO/YrdC/YwlC family)